MPDFLVIAYTDRSIVGGIVQEHRGSGCALGRVLRSSWGCVAWCPAWEASSMRSCANGAQEDS
eukprot:5401271-Prorocentrum_lima.AAC.1